MSKTKFILPVFFFLVIGKFVDAKSLTSNRNLNDSTDLTISYQIAYATVRPGVDLGESYNGAVKTVFASQRSVRLRLVSLMRIQSVIIDIGEKNDSLITLIRESGKNKAVQRVSTDHWTLLHSKYEGSKVEWLNDRVNILGYECKNANVTLKDNTSLTVYYTNQIKHNLFQHAEPMFRDIPGVVLKYVYRNKKSSLTYTAVLLSRNKIDPGVFEVEK